MVWPSTVQRGSDLHAHLHTHPVVILMHALWDTVPAWQQTEHLAQHAALSVHPFPLALCGAYVALDCEPAHETGPVCVTCIWPDILPHPAWLPGAQARTPVGAQTARCPGNIGRGNQWAPLGAM